MYTLKRRQFAGATALLGLSAGLQSGLAKAQPVADSVNTHLLPPDPVIHVLSRTGYGISNNQLNLIQAIGLPAYLEQQLYPETIDDSAAEAFVAEHFPRIFLSTGELFQVSEEERRRAPAELKLATLYRRWFSHRQLYELMVEFWSDHFNIYQDSGPLRFLKLEDDREVIRPHALGRFADLLHASARSPAMLYYLDNYRNFVTGPNENYARELMELHTLGVDGGYTEQDVLEVARCFTGWSLERRGPQRGSFRFYPELHDRGEKTVLDTTIPAGGGMEDGLHVLDLLATHPSTARFIAEKLCRRLVADNPPPTLVDRLAETFTETDGDIRALLHTLLGSEEFRGAADAKLKRPVEFLGAVLRGLEPAIDRRGVRQLIRITQALGQVPFSWPPPNGYPDVMNYWASTNGLLNRWNFVVALSEGRLEGLSIDPSSLLDGVSTPEQAVDRLAERLLRRSLDPQDRQLLIAYAKQGSPAGLIGLLLASDYFQYR